MEDAGPELALRKLTQTFGVTGYVILNKNGIPVQFYGMEEPRAIQFAGLFSELALAASSFLRRRYTDMTSEEDQELVALRLRTHECEYIVCPEKDYCLIVVHNPNWVEPPPTEVVATGGDGEEDGGEGGEGGEDGGGTAR